MKAAYFMIRPRYASWPITQIRDVNEKLVTSLEKQEP